MNKRSLVVYHKVDSDGLCSMMIAKSWYQKEGWSVDIFGFNYGDTLPDIDAFLRVYDEICLVDISFPAEIMKLFKKSGRVLWIDHHITAIQASENEGYSDMKGVRVNGRAACELAWAFFYGPEITIPEFVTLCGIYDTWRKDERDWKGEVLPLQNMIRMEYGTKPELWEEAWSDLINEDKILLNQFIQQGRAIVRFMDSTCISWVKNYSFEVLVNGKYKAICMLTPMFGSGCFESVLEDYDIYITANKGKTNTGDYTYRLSMYKEPGRLEEFNCGEYLKSFGLGGGGHASAAGTELTADLFVRLVEDREI